MVGEHRQEWHPLLEMTFIICFPVIILIWFIVVLFCTTIISSLPYKMDAFMVTTKDTI